MQRILLVEDDPLVALMLEEYLDVLGHTAAATADDENSALGHIACGDFDAAIVDVYLGCGHPCDGVAEALSAADIPFLIATGGFIDAPGPVWAGRPVLSKPFSFESLERALETLE